MEGLILHEGALSSNYRITGRRKKGTGLGVPCKYIYYYGATEDPVFIQDAAFSFVIMLFPPAT